ncbi:hypothetical protein HYH03_002163 [Edaphochlamys debaryana]|uniref:BFN domain-containing protein n=1 Tax=Edaphochlamys debaryana TaxID=47281 RepID=A0A836C5M8_9CHLO|nr:hypothetical protein HYH03_002163 [Edaphochlamys debaryana]|eukprot:KAG2499872.1 hypothetical protein HYH03_002163 [Edaphochlamys debaryana]
MKILPASDQYANSYSGVLVFQRSTEPTLTPDTPILEIFVAGDVAGLIYTQLHGHKANRPMVHDLMFDIIQRAAQVSRDQWQLLRVAVVALENDIFVGRLYFGDPVTGKVMWDCDCRPSDGIALGLKTGCPFYVAHSVWDQAAVSICKSKVHMIAVHEAHMATQAQQQAAPQQQQQQSTAQQPPATQQQQQVGDAPSSSGGSPAKTARGSRELPVGPGSNNDRMGGSTSLSSHDDYTALKAGDPEVIKLLKRELEVAVNEEDYAAAIRLRDHPYLQLYRRIEAFSMVGAADEAASLQQELDALIARDSAHAQ